MILPRIFTGGKGPEDFLSWVEDVDNFIHHNQVPSWEKLRLAISLLRSEAKFWWKAEEYVRCEEEEPIITWEELKITMSTMYVPNFQWEESEFDFSCVEEIKEEEPKAVSVITHDQNVVEETEFNGSKSVCEKEHTMVKTGENHGLFFCFDQLQPVIWIKYNLVEHLRHVNRVQHFVFEPGGMACVSSNKTNTLDKRTTTSKLSIDGSFILEGPDLRSNPFKGGGNDAILTSLVLRQQDNRVSCLENRFDVGAFKGAYLSNQRELGNKLDCYGKLTHQSIFSNWFHHNDIKELRAMELTIWVNPDFRRTDISSLQRMFQPNQKEPICKPILSTNLTHNISFRSWFQVNSYLELKVMNFLNRRFYRLLFCEYQALDVDCVPGSTSNDCSVCIKTASDRLKGSCGNTNEAYSWLGEPTLCHVHYSNTYFYGTANLDQTNMVYDRGDNLNQTEFTKIWENLVVRMILAASTTKNTPSSSNKHYIADVSALTTSEDIYALMQCTPDLSSHDCEACLQRDYRSCCSQTQGGTILMPSCFFRWDLYPFSKAFDNITVVSPNTQRQPPSGNDKSSKNYVYCDKRTSQKFCPFAGSKKLSIETIVAIIVPIVVVIFIIIILVLLAGRSATLLWRRKPYKEFDLYRSGITPESSLQLDFKTIEVATKKFSNKLGQGGFGEVFKGTLPNGTEVAVKRLSKTSSQGAQEFRNEVAVVAKLQHRNLVRLHGFCLEGEEKILVYEFVPNKSLDYLLFDPRKQAQLDWTKRYNIIDGITRGILYLHQDSRLTIIHRDLKASNILLDDDMNPKIADFGMARIFDLDQSRLNTNRIVGTRGYMPPEYVMQGLFSTKSDVYSFGVLVLEIISGRTNTFDYQSDTVVENLVTHAWRCWRDGTPLDLVDPTISENCRTDEVTRCIHIALLCVQHDPTDRPNLPTINMMLTTRSTLDLPGPNPPGFFFPNRGNREREASESSQSTIMYCSQTINDVTITDLGPR